MKMNEKKLHKFEARPTASTGFRKRKKDYKTKALKLKKSLSKIKADSKKKFNFKNEGGFNQRHERRKKKNNTGQSNNRMKNSRRVNLKKIPRALSLKLSQYTSNQLGSTHDTLESPAISTPSQQGAKKRRISMYHRSNTGKKKKKLNRRTQQGFVIRRGIKFSRPKSEQTMRFSHKDEVQSSKETSQKSRSRKSTFSGISTNQRPVIRERASRKTSISDSKKSSLMREKVLKNLEIGINQMDNMEEIVSPLHFSAKGSTAAEAGNDNDSTSIKLFNGFNTFNITPSYIYNLEQEESVESEEMEDERKCDDDSSYQNLPTPNENKVMNFNLLLPPQPPHQLKRNRKLSIKIKKDIEDREKMIMRNGSKEYQILHDNPPLELRSRASSYNLEYNPSENLVGVNDFNDDFFKDKFKDLIKGNEIGRGKFIRV